MTFNNLWTAKNMGVNYTFFIWQRVNETKKVRTTVLEQYGRKIFCLQYI